MRLGVICGCCRMLLSLMSRLATPGSTISGSSVEQRYEVFRCGSQEAWGTELHVGDVLLIKVF